jgi:hypothetical protein
VGIGGTGLSAAKAGSYSVGSGCVKIDQVLTDTHRPPFMALRAKACATVC